MGMWRPQGDNVGTTWGQHEDNVETTRDHGDVETTWGQHGDNVGTTWGPWGCGDHMGTMQGQHGDHRDVETTWGQHGDNVGTT